MNTPSATSTRCTASPPSLKELKPTSTAAMPTNECSIAMSSGICVISTLRAIGMPMLAPMASTSTMSSRVTSTERRPVGSSADR